MEEENLSLLQSEKTLESENADLAGKNVLSRENELLKEDELQKENELPVEENEEVFSEEDQGFMREALSLAQKAFDQEDTPIGAVLVYQGRVIGRGYNQRNARKNSLCHAEIEAINEASCEIGDWRLEETTLYVTLEPCPMCAGAIVQARIPEVVIGTMNPKAGCAGSVVNLLQQPKLNHQVRIRKGLLQPECAAMMKQFFAQLRLKQKQEKEQRMQEQNKKPDETGNGAE